MGVGFGYDKQGIGGGTAWFCGDLSWRGVGTFAAHVSRVEPWGQQCGWSLFAPASSFVQMAATLIPALTSELASSGVTDPTLRRVSYGVRVAFRSRRSLLLTSLAHQVCG